MLSCKNETCQKIIHTCSIVSPTWPRLGVKSNYQPLLHVQGW
jgi:hypothetical protein